MLIEILIDGMTSRSHDCERGRLSPEEQNAALLDVKNERFQLDPLIDESTIYFFFSFQGGLKYD